MQNLDVISINLWQVLISLCNLLLLFLILKKFLYQPVRKLLAQRKAQLDEQYRKAEQAQQAAEENRQTYERQLADAHAQAERILQTAAGQADHRAERIVADAREKADGIVREAQTQAALEQKKAQAGIKQEIVDVSAVLAAKLLEREIRPADHRALIDAAIADMGEIGDANDGHQ